jgi:hypothetical protein
MNNITPPSTLDPASSKAPLPTIARLLGCSKVTRKRSEHDLKAFSPILLTLLGISIVVRLVPPNASSYIVSNVLPAAKVTDARGEQ